MPQSSSCLCNMLIKFDTVQAQAAMTLRCQALWDRPAQITAGRGVVQLPRLLRACLTVTQKKCTCLVLCWHCWLYQAAQMPLPTGRPHQRGTRSRTGSAVFDWTPDLCSLRLQKGAVPQIRHQQQQLAQAHFVLLSCSPKHVMIPQGSTEDSGVLTCATLASVDADLFAPGCSTTRRAPVEPPLLLAVGARLTPPPSWCAARIT